ncbi:uncharacterized protein ZBIST_2791 [Zygosaccharomyces bailii]|uniref:ZYBA0S09-05072g1_1 n=1 Tax=Zygosaccharomyces bailii (strain CLIB 213 / ATCC 58445 / CBS 680 / BCRC 21525 / NBRC 1098 / NCYC 1416 / NRRL Y-2227) TaxID=1333698 RepID=A0A8J2XA40_ZYGB2|nr:ZYBA0S09-05072g1_1 [Zygosaccharomyces bailii CLIB 213]SJM86312.1 uncharacterized protein ZBIST_2791 [Zygosaccharomyces bailii]
MSDSGNNSFKGPEDLDSPGATRYGGYSRGYSSRGYHRGGGSGGRYASYSNGDNNYSPYHYRGGDSYYGSRYAGRGAPNSGGSVGANSGYYHSRGGGGNYNGQRYNQSYTSDYNYPYYRGGNNGVAGRRSQDNENRRYSANSGSRYHSSRRSEPWGGVTDSATQGVPLYGSGNNTPVDTYHRSHSPAPKSDITPSSHNVNTGAYTAVPTKSRVDKNDSAFLYLTDLDKSTDDPKELENIREVFKESDRLDKALEEHNFLLLKNELELGLLATQCEKDTLSVRLTQEKLDTFLMES